MNIYAFLSDYPGEKMTVVGTSVDSFETAQLAAREINEATCHKYDDDVMHIVLTDEDGNCQAWNVFAYRVVNYAVEKSV